MGCAQKTLTMPLGHDYFQGIGETKRNITCAFQSCARMISVSRIGACPAEVPSCFYLADSFLALDKLLGSHLLIPIDGVTKAEKAGQEAKRIKKLMGSLRHLFRNSFLD